MLDLRWRIDVLTNQWKYEEANKYKLFLETLEEEERGKQLNEFEKVQAMREKKLK